MKNAQPSKSPNVSTRFLSCTLCPAKPLCLVYASDPGQQLISSQHHQHFPVFAPGSHIYWEGESLQDLYIVRSGCIKTYAVDEDGNERIRGFHLPGDILALDALEAGCYQSNASAITSASVCSVHHRQLLSIGTRHPELFRRLLARLSADLSTALVWSGEYSAEERLAAFLLDLNQRERNQGLVDGNIIKLMISRRDIASYLRLAPETVSRNLTRLEKRGLILCSTRELKILDADSLYQIARPVGIAQRPNQEKRAA